MTRAEWELAASQKAKRDQERRKLEAHFNSEIIRRHRSGESKEQIVAGLGISRELFNRVMRSLMAAD